MIFDKDPSLQGVPQKKLAVLIDADNAQPEIIEGLLAEIVLYSEREEDLRELDNPQPSALERSFAELLNPAHTTI